MVQTQLPTIGGLIALAAADNPDKSVLLASGRTALSYGTLYQQVLETVDKLNSLGFGRHDRVALMIPNGPELAVALLAVASGTVTAVLDSAETKPELEALFKRLGIQVLIYLPSADGESAAVLSIAHAYGIPIIDLIPNVSGEAGTFTLSGINVSRTVEPGFAQPDDIASLSTTSGTTSSVKIVPLLQSTFIQRNTLAIDYLRLTDTDRHLSVAPLHHQAGQSQLMRTVASRSSIMQLPGFEVNSFFNWLGIIRRN